jgi:hypothetical protein
MKVTEISLGPGKCLQAAVRISARVEYDTPGLDAESYWYEFPEEFKDELSDAGDAWLIALLPLAVTVNEAITIDAPVDPLLLENAYELMDAWRFWHPNLPLVSLDVPMSEYQVQLTSRTRNGQFFSGGIDSFYTALRHGEHGARTSNDLIFCWGFDVPLTEVDAMDRLRDALSRTAGLLDRRLIIVATNIRETQFGRLDWGHFSHGCAMASVGLLLERVYRRLLIPSSDGYYEAEAYGSHAFTDHLFSTSNMQVIHDGAASSRQQKVELVARYPQALEGLRVCWQSLSDKNCGQCEKCMRTMIDLDLCGVLSDVPAFEHAQLDLKRIKRIYTTDHVAGIPLYYEQMLDRAIDLNRGDLAAALRACLSRSKRYERLLNLLNFIKGLPYCYRMADFVERRIRRRLIY